MQNNKNSKENFLKEFLKVTHAGKVYTSWLDFHAAFASLFFSNKRRPAFPISVSLRFVRPLDLHGQQLTVNSRCRDVISRELARAQCNLCTPEIGSSSRELTRDRISTSGIDCELLTVEISLSRYPKRGWDRPLAIKWWSTVTNDAQATGWGNRAAWAAEPTWIHAPFVTVLDHWIANGRSQPFWISREWDLHAQQLKFSFRCRDAISRELARDERPLKFVVSFFNSTLIYNICQRHFSKALYVIPIDGPHVWDAYGRAQIGWTK